MMSKSTKAQPLQFARSATAWRPHAYQMRAVRFLLKNAGAALFLDPGLGKTSIVLAAVRSLKKAGVFGSALVIAPLRVCYAVWPDEIKKWTDFKDIKVVVLHGKDKAALLKTKADLYVINPDGIPWLLEQDLSKFKPDTLILDESTQYKKTNTARFKLIKKLLPKFSRRWILTGSPAPNGLMDLFGQIYIIDLGVRLGRFITHFRQMYFYPTGFDGFDWELKEGADKKIYKAIKPIALRLDAADYLELPALIGWGTPIFVDLPPKARKLYDEMEEIMVAELSKGNYATAVNAASALNKCAQIANGGIYHPKFEDREPDDFSKIEMTWTKVHDEKTDAVKEILDSIQGHQALIAYDYKHDLARLQEALKRGKVVPPYIGGGVTPAKAEELIQKWNLQKLPVLLGNPASMAHGLNMQTGGAHLIWHSLTFNYEYWMQMNRRLLRQGSIHKYIFAYPIIARDTVDEAKYFALAGKGKVEGGLLNALRVYVKRRG